MRGTENPHCSKQTMQSRFFFFFFPLAYNTLLESPYAQLQAEGGRGRGGAIRALTSIPHDKEASPSAGARTSAYFSLESIVAKWPTCK